MAARICSLSERGFDFIHAVANQFEIVVRIDQQTFDARRTNDLDVTHAGGDIIDPPDILAKRKVEYRVDRKDRHIVGCSKTDFHRGRLTDISVWGYEPNEIRGSY